MAEFYVEIGEDGVPFVKVGKHLLRLDLEPLSGEYKAKSVAELRETPENVSAALKKMRKLIREDEGLNVPIDDEDFLLKFLRPCKFYPNSAFALMQRFYRFKTKFPQYSLNLTPYLVEKVFNKEVIVFLPTRTKCGARIMIANCGTKWNPKEVTLQDLFRTVMVSIETAMMETKTQVGGVHVILNMEGLSLMHVYQFSPSMAKLMVDWVQDCTPVRLKGIHIINQSFIFNMAYAIFRPFLGDKLKKRIFFHGSNKRSLFSRIDSDALPTSMGGTGDLPDYPGALLSEMLTYYEDTFIKHNGYGYSLEDVSSSSEEDDP